VSTPLSPRERRLYAVINTCAAPVWLLMIAAPRAALSMRAVRVALLLTWLAGPSGLAVWLGQSAVARRG